jgi:phage tail-like protein
MANTDLIGHDPLLARNFFLEVDGQVLTILSGVSGLDVEVEVATATQVGPSGRSQTIKTLGNAQKAPDITLERIAAPSATDDKLWMWFNAILNSGMKLNDRATQRKNGAIVLYDSAMSEIGRFNFTNGWPSKISTSGLSAEGSDVVKETITLTVERLVREK